MLIKQLKTLVGLPLLLKKSYEGNLLEWLYAAFNENFRVGFARACRCLRCRGGAGTGNVTTGRAGGQSMTGRNATDQNRLRLATSYEVRKSVAGQRIELVDIVAAGSRTAAGLDEVQVAERDDARVVGGEHNEFDALVTQPGCTSTS